MRNNNKSIILSNKREWFIIINKKQEGPFSTNDLKKDNRFNPDTFVWKSGFSKWIQARYVADLQLIFKDSNKSNPLHDINNGKNIDSSVNRNEVTLTMRYDPNLMFLWIIIILVILFYTFFQLYKN